MKDQIRNIEDPKQPILLSGKVWSYCSEVAKKHEGKPIDVFRKIIAIGKFVSEIIEADGSKGSIKWIKPDGFEVDLKNLDESKN